MILLWIGLWCLALLASAFFSGSETGLYRIPRLRLIADSASGDRRARRLLALLNRPSLFVATALVGNNIANYLLGLSTVLAVQTIGGEGSTAIELLVPLLTSPIVFIYGELSPKHVFYQAPYRLVRMLEPLIMTITFLLLPLSLILWGLGSVLGRIVGQSPAKTRASLQRHELERVLQESHEIGLLAVAQRDLATHLFAVGGRHVGEFGRPASRFASVRIGRRFSDALARTRREGRSVLLVYGDDAREPVGYVRTIDLLLGESSVLIDYEPLTTIGHREPHGDALIRMQSLRQDVVKVVDEAGRMTGIVHLDALIEPLLSGSLVALRRSGGRSTGAPLGGLAEL